jgi:hypothetical protein
LVQIRIPVLNDSHAKKKQHENIYHRYRFQPRDGRGTHSRIRSGINVTQLDISVIKNRLQDNYYCWMETVSASTQGRAGSPLPADGGASVLASGLVSSLAPPQDDGAHGVTRPTESLVRIIAEPTTPNEAATLAAEDKFQFQWWALGPVGARAVELKKGADHGIDAKSFFATTRRPPAKARVSASTFITPTPSANGPTIANPTLASSTKDSTKPKLKAGPS